MNSFADTSLSSEFVENTTAQLGTHPVMALVVSVVVLWEV